MEKIDEIRKRVQKIVNPWPNGLASRLKSTQVCNLNQNLRARISLVNAFYKNRLLAINLCGFPLGGQTVKNLRLLATKFGLGQSQRKSTQVHASRCKSTQVCGQTKRKLNASPKLASTCESVWPGLKCTNSQNH